MSAASGRATVDARLLADRTQARPTLGQAWRNRLIPLGAGVLAAAALPPVHALPLLIPAFMILVWRLDRAASGWRAFGAGFWFACGFHIAGLYWLAWPLTLDIARFGWMIPFAVFGISGGLAIVTGLAMLAVHASRARGLGRILLLAAAWAAAEWLRGHILSGFPWNLLANAWTAVPDMLQGAAYVGAYGLGALTVLIAALPALWVDPASPRSHRIGGTAAAVVLLVALWAGGAWRLASHPTETVAGVRLRIVQGAIPQTLKWDPAERLRNFEIYLRLSGTPAATPVTHLVWPETALDFRFQTAYEGARLTPGMMAAVKQAIPPKGLLLTGVVRDDGRRTWNSLQVLARSGRVVASYDKHHLVPFGEYVPARGILQALGVEKIAHGRGDFSAGPSPRTLELPGLPGVGPQICYEAIFPGNVVGRPRPGWMLNVTNDAWFGYTSGPFQHLASARMRAVEEGLPLVRAANTGISAVVDAYGRTVARLGLDRRGVLDAPLPRPSPPTLYARFGDWMFLPLLLVIISIGAIFDVQRRRATLS